MSETWSTDRVYTYEQDGQWFVFTSPDGVGKIFHTNEREAMEQTGIRSVVHLMGAPLD